MLDLVVLLPLKGVSVLPLLPMSTAVTGYLENAFAKDPTPSLFVLEDKPTKISRPVNKTSPPSNNAGSTISTIFKPE